MGFDPCSPDISAISAHPDEYRSSGSPALSAYWKQGSQYQLFNITGSILHIREQSALFSGLSEVQQFVIFSTL